ncbi:hypothetical protein BV898_18367 [Hypsibius exemplaris]|uniref:Uncharacterized protein n=1 Tax=Hypsibius exemplaris TaxID=2072580 RepID=A0A9X6RN27_HYPEX|nr:hypothetical protein BV898_18367 [Hypsibius exemplaris]
MAKVGSASEFAPLPTLILQCFGLIPVPLAPKLIRSFLQFIAAVHLAGAVVGLLILGLRDTAYLLTYSHEHGVAEILSVAPLFSQYGRSTAITLLFLIKRRAYYQLSEAVAQITSHVTETRRFALYKQWSERSATWTFLALGLQAIGCLSSSLPPLLIHEEHDYHYTENITVATDDHSFPIESSVLTSESLKWVGFYFNVSSFLLSQQVLILAVVSAVVLRSLIVNRNSEIDQLIQDVTSGKIQKKVLLKQLTTIGKQASDNLLLNDYITVVFGYILFLAFVLDQVTILGTIADGVGSPDTGIAFWIYRFTYVIIVLVLKVIIVLVLKVIIVLVLKVIIVLVLKVIIVLVLKVIIVLVLKVIIVLVLKVIIVLVLKVIIVLVLKVIIVFVLKVIIVLVLKVIIVLVLKVIIVLVLEVIIVLVLKVSKL